jgi:hypothetical protein
LGGILPKYKSTWVVICLSTYYLLNYSYMIIHIQYIYILYVLCICTHTSIYIHIHISYNTFIYTDHHIPSRNYCPNSFLKSHACLSLLQGNYHLYIYIQRIKYTHRWIFIHDQTCMYIIDIYIIIYNIRISAPAVASLKSPPLWSLCFPPGAQSNQNPSLTSLRILHCNLPTFLKLADLHWHRNWAAVSIVSDPRVHKASDFFLVAVWHGTDPL